MSSVQLSDEETVEAVREALDMLPPQFARELAGVAVIPVVIVAPDGGPTTQAGTISPAMTAGKVTFSRTLIPSSRLKN